MKKYELIESDISGLYRIRALMNFSDVKKGYIGGYVSGEHNLAHYGNCWIYDNAKVYDNAVIYGNAKVYNNVRIYNNAKVFDNVRIYNNAKVFDDAKIYNNAKVFDDAKIYNNAKVFDNAKVCNNAKIYGNVEIYVNAAVYNNAEIYGNAKIYDNAKIYNNAEIYGTAEIYGNTIIRGKTHIKGNYKTDNGYYCFDSFYKYHSQPVFDGSDTKKIQLGCYERTIDEWRNNFWNNEEEFPKGSKEAEYRLKALNMCLIWLGEEPIKMKDILLKENKMKKFKNDLKLKLYYKTLKVIYKPIKYKNKLSINNYKYFIKIKNLNTNNKNENDK